MDGWRGGGHNKFDAHHHPHPPPFFSSDKGLGRGWRLYLQEGVFGSARAWAERSKARRNGGRRGMKGGFFVCEFFGSNIEGLKGRFGALLAALGIDVDGRGVDIPYLCC